MATKTEIVNIALIKLGVRTVDDIDVDTTIEANAVNAVYDDALKNVLSEMLWSFATKRAMLVVSADPIIFTTYEENYTVRYDTPTDAVYIGSTNIKQAKWSLENGKILSDTASLGVKYTYLNEDEASYPPYFIEALSDYLAYQLTFKILNSRSMRESMFNVYKSESLPVAKSKDSQIGTPEQIHSDYMERARYLGADMEDF